MHDIMTQKILELGHDVQNRRVELSWAELCRYKSGFTLPLDGSHFGFHSRGDVYSVWNVDSANGVVQLTILSASKHLFVKPLSAATCHSCILWHGEGLWYNLKIRNHERSTLCRFCRLHAYISVSTGDKSEILVPKQFSGSANFTMSSNLSPSDRYCHSNKSLAT